MKIRQLQEADRSEWQALWEGYQHFYNADLSSQHDALWVRLIASDNAPEGDGPFCLVAENENGALVGFTHFLYHQTTWSTRDRCYLNDLYTSESARGRGVARALIEAVYDHAGKRGSDQVYWLTQEYNTDARRLYDKVATKTDFIKYAR